MIIEEIKIRNFRALKDVTLNVADFNCMIGANNAGKSSVLQAIQTFLGVKQLADTDYYDTNEPVKITVTARVTEKDLEAVVDDEQRTRLYALCEAGTLVLTYIGAIGQKPRLARKGLEPKDPAKAFEAFETAITGKQGAELRATVLATFPELAEAVGRLVPPPKTQKDFKELYRNHLRSLPTEAVVMRDDLPLPTGIDAPVRSLFPDVIFVPAVRDAADDVKTADKAAFGKLIGLLLHSISSDIASLKAELSKLDRMLNVIVDSSGATTDERLEQVKLLEATVQRNVRESFPSVTLKMSIPPPEPKLILQQGRLDLNDAVLGPVETKGDGLKRALIFSLLRAYAELAKRPEWNPDGAAGRHLLMFEEPEIFLHPAAQKLLFEALHEVSSGMQVIVTTHSPLFFSATRTSGFSKLIKDPKADEKPFSELISIDFEKTIDLKTQFQVLCYENHNAAFFSDRVVLVEGDSDLTALQHAARLIDPSWDFEQRGVHLVKVGGKANFKRFVDFFSHFKMKVVVVADLDCIVDGFADLPIPSGSPTAQARNDLRNHAVARCPEYQADADQTNNTWRAAGSKLRKLIEKVRLGQTPSAEDKELMDWMDGKLGRNRALLAVLASDLTLRDEKMGLLSALRKEGVVVWEKGSIEAYYGFPVNADRKTEAAERYRNEVRTREAVMALASNVDDGAGSQRNELLLAFETMFGVGHNPPLEPGPPPVVAPSPRG